MNHPHQFFIQNLFALKNEVKYFHCSQQKGRKSTLKREIKNEEEVGKDQNCGDGGNSRMRRENNKVVEEGIKGEKIEEGK